MTITIHVVVRTQFEALHHWADAPDEVAFLRSPHRHIFHVEMRVPVGHDDRQVEFILLKRCLDNCIQTLASEMDTSRWSCERWGRELVSVGWEVHSDGQVNIATEQSDNCVFVDCVFVSEDGENGAMVQR